MKLIKSFVRVGYSKRHYLEYGVVKKKDYIPLSDNGQINLSFYARKDELYLDINLFGTCFSLNMSNPKYK